MVGRLTRRRAHAVAALGPALLAVTLLSGCAAMMKVKAPMTPYDHYVSGDPAQAEAGIAARAAAEVAADGRNKNLLLWDLGMYQFSQGKYREAIDSFKQSVSDRERLYSAGETIASIALKSASSAKYLGDPVEVGAAYLFMGLSFYMLDDLENAIVCLRRSTEEELSSDDTKIGDMAITNYMLGECYLRAGRHDDAIVALKRAAAHAPDLMPAYATLLACARKCNNQEALEYAEEALAARPDSALARRVLENPRQGLTLVLMGDPPDYVSPGTIGAFRKREEVSAKALRERSWRVAVDDGPAQALSDADYMHTHLTDQGGFGGELARQGGKKAVGVAVDKLADRVGGLFGGFLKAAKPSTAADLRYWSTMPGRFRIGFVPLEPGTHSVTLAVHDRKGREDLARRHRFDGVTIPADGRLLLLVNEYVKSSPEQIGKVIN